LVREVIACIKNSEKALTWAMAFESFSPTKQGIRPLNIFFLLFVQRQEHMKEESLE